MSDRQLSPVTRDLIKAKELIRDEKNWCRDRMHDGHRFCSLGALLGVHARFFDTEGCYPFLKLAAKEQGYHCVQNLNDSHPEGHKAVMRMFDRAIELSMKGQS